MNREITGQIGQAPYRLAGGMDDITALAPLDTNGHRTPFLQRDVPYESEQLLALTDLPIGVCAAEGSHPTEKMDGFQQTGFTGGIGTGDEIEPAAE
jgi:hypothetical protein